MPTVKQEVTRKRRIERFETSDGRVVNLNRSCKFDTSRLFSDRVIFVEFENGRFEAFWNVIYASGEHV